MSFLDTFEYGPKYGGLDSASQFDGMPVDAAYLRALARNANRLAIKRYQVFRYFFCSDPGQADSSAPGDARAFASMLWKPLIRRRLPIFKLPGGTEYKINLCYLIETAGDIVNVQFSTNAYPFNPLSIFAPGTNVIQLDATGSRQAAQAFVPADPGIQDEISIDIQGMVTSRDGNTGTYGSPNSGNVSFFAGTPTGQMLVVAAGNTWNTTGNTWATGGHCVQFFANGMPVWTAQITDVGYWIPNDNTSMRVLSFEPAMPNTDFSRISSHGSVSVTYAIKELPKIRVFDVVGWTHGRSA